MPLTRRAKHWHDGIIAELVGRRRHHMPSLPGRGEDLTGRLDCEQTLQARHRQDLVARQTKTNLGLPSSVSRFFPADSQQTVCLTSV
jgi:hypothetical protein